HHETPARGSGGDGRSQPATLLSPADVPDLSALLRLHSRAHRPRRRALDHALVRRSRPHAHVHRELSRGPVVERRARVVALGGGAVLSVVACRPPRRVAAARLPLWIHAAQRMHRPVHRLVRDLSDGPRGSDSQFTPARLRRRHQLLDLSLAAALPQQARGGGPHELSVESRPRRSGGPRVVLRRRAADLAPAAAHRGAPLRRSAPEWMRRTPTMRYPLLLAVAGAAAVAG